MKLLLISHGSGPYGAERVLLELARRLASRGYEVVLSLPHPGVAVDHARHLSGVTLRVGERRRLPRTVGEGLAYFLGGPADVVAVRKLVEDVRPDVTWINSMYNPWAAVGARLAGFPTVWHLHERSMRGIPGALLASVIRVTADRAVAVSEYAAGSFRHFPWLGTRVDVIQNPLLHQSDLPLEPPPGCFTIGYVGQLEPRKRVSDIVRAIALLPEDVHGILVGGGKAFSSIEATIGEVGVEERIHLAGYRSDVSAQLARFHCLVVPSLEEAFGLAGLEAMARGVPVIAARSGALPEVLGDAALYHEPEDPSSIARQVRRIRREPGLREELGARGLARAARFRPDAWLDSVEDLLKEIAFAGPRDQYLSPR